MLALIAVPPLRYLRFNMFCSQCGDQVADNARFCSSCGSAVAAPAQSIAPIAAAPPPPKARSQKAVTLQLTETEQEHLIWQDGDVLEILCGNISFTSKRQYREIQSSTSPILTDVGFIFETSDPTWNGNEWEITTDTQLPNGPALLILYRRGNAANAFGIVSMVNRGWLHALPLRSVRLMKDSVKFKQLDKAEWANLAKGLGGAFLGAIFTGGLAASAGAKAATKQSGAKVVATVEAIHTSARLMMHRIAQTADTYWEGGGNSMSGRL